MKLTYTDSTGTVQELREGLTFVLEPSDTLSESLPEKPITLTVVAIDYENGVVTLQ